MAEKNKKKKQKVRGMPATSIQSRMPSKAAKGQAGKKSIMPGLTGAVKAAKARRKKRISSDKWVLGEKFTKAGRERAKARKQKRQSAKGTGIISTKKSRAKAIGAKAGTQVRRKAVKVVKSKAKQDYVKYEKKSKAAKSFRSTFKSKCACGAKSFSWDGRSYSCAKK